MWPQSDITLELLGNAKRGDNAAVNSLLDRHRDSLRRMVQMRLDKALAQRVDASDVVQDVLLEASTRLEDYIREPKLPFHLWLRQLAKDRMIDLHRRHRGAKRRSVDRERPLASPAYADRSTFDMAAQIRDHELTPAATAIRKELEQRYLTALDSLQELDREIILMRHHEKLGNSEVAQVLGLTPPAAGMRYTRAMKRLRTILGDASATG